MTTKRRHSAFLSVCIAFLILGTANHCAFEDLFVAFSNKIFGVSAPTHSLNHLGSNSKHKHKDAADSPEHEHGQPHPLDLITTAHKGANYYRLDIVAFPSIFRPVFGLQFKVADLMLMAACILPFATGDPPGSLRQFIDSLTLAPQAPPIRA